MFINIGFPGFLFMLLIICIPLAIIFKVARFFINNEKRAEEFRTKLLDRMERLERNIKK